MVFAWFDTKDVDALVDRLVADFVQKIPPTGTGLSAKKEEAKLRKTHDQILRQVREFVQAHTLNVYKKARLANRFKWALIGAGYPSWFVDEVAYELAAVSAAPNRTGGSDKPRG